MSAPRRGLKARPAPLSIRVNDEQRQQLAVRAGGLPISSYIKAVLFGTEAEATRRPRAVCTDRQLLARVLAAFGESRLASNLNQLARAANSGSLFCDEQTTARLAEACEAIASIRTLLMQALGKRLPDAAAATHGQGSVNAEDGSC